MSMLCWKIATGNLTRLLIQCWVETFSALQHSPLCTGWDCLLYCVYSKVVIRAASADLTGLNPDSKLHPCPMKRRVALRRNAVKNYLAARLFLPDESCPRFSGGEKSTRHARSEPGAAAVRRKSRLPQPHSDPRAEAAGAAPPAAPPDPRGDAPAGRARPPHWDVRDVTPGPGAGAARQLRARPGRSRGRTPAQRSQAPLPEPGAPTGEGNILLPGRSWALPCPAEQVSL